MSPLLLKRAVMVLLALAGIWSVAVFVGALDLGTPGAAEQAASGPLFRAVLYPVLAVLLLVLLAGVLLELRQRRTPAVHRRLELTWVAIPAVLLLAVAVGERELRAGFERPTVEVLAGLEVWTGLELETQAGEPVQLSLRTSDVAHTLVAPELDVRFAIVPGQPTTALLPAPRVGEFELSCSVHARVVGYLRVLPTP